MRGLTDLERHILSVAIRNGGRCGFGVYESLDGGPPGADVTPECQAACERLRDRGVITLDPCPRGHSGVHPTPAPLATHLLELDRLARGLAAA